MMLISHIPTDANYTICRMGKTGPWVKRTPLHSCLNVDKCWPIFDIIAPSNSAVYLELECGPMPNVMVALPNIDGALCSTPQSLVDAHY